MAEIPDDELAALRTRLEAAERVCLMFGWTAHHNTPRDNAAHELWREWLEIPGVSADPKDHPELSDERITELAARYDVRRELTLARASRIICSHQPACADMTEHAAVLESAAG